MPINAVIFDLYGTLVKGVSTTAQRRVLPEIADVLAVPLDSFISAWDDGFLKREVGALSYEAQFDQIYQELGLPVDSTRISEATRRRLEFERATLRDIRADALETLSSLKASGVLLGLISNCGPGTPKLWPEMVFTQFIDVPIRSSAVGLAKPDPRIYRMALNQLEIEPQESLHVGDGMDNELTGARDVGLNPVLLRSADEDFSDPRRDDARSWEGPVVQYLVEILGYVS